jgi:peptide deformylase
MAVLPILEAPHPLLKVKAESADPADASLRALARDMLETMYVAPGIGLAAPQVGALKRLFVVDVADKKKGEEPAPTVLLNPEVTWRSEEEVSLEEGCLSVPGHFAEVLRPREVRMRYQDLEGELREIEADGLLARCLQHELDHLDGVLFIDRISVLKRGMIMRKLAKSRRARD